MEKTTYIAVLLLSLVYGSCVKEEVVQLNFEPIAYDFSATIEENPSKNEELGKLIGEIITNESVLPLYKIISQTPNGALSINTMDGTISVKDPKLFDYEKHPTITALAGVGNYDKFDTATITINLKDIKEASARLQARIYNGETPYEIYQSDNSLLDSIYGLQYEGGLIFFLNIGNGEGMVAAKSDNPKAPWGCLVHYAGIYTYYGAGKENTEIITKYCKESSAAAICDKLSMGGYDDWFLPSDQELVQMHENIYKKGYSEFQNDRYWSSSQSGKEKGIARPFDSGRILTYYPKNGKLLSRAVRNF